MEKEGEALFPQLTPTPTVCSGLGPCSGSGCWLVSPSQPLVGLSPNIVSCPLASPLTQLVLDSDFLLSSLRKSTVVLVVKNPPANAGDVRDTGSIPGLGRSPGDVIGNPLQYSCLENPHGQRSLVGYSPWGHKELDMQLNMHLPAYVCRGFRRDQVHSGWHGHRLCWDFCKCLD